MLISSFKFNRLICPSLDMCSASISWSFALSRAHSRCCCRNDKKLGRQRWMDASACMDGEREKCCLRSLEHAKAEIARLKKCDADCMVPRLLRLLWLNAAPLSHYVYSLIARASSNCCKFHANLLRCDDCFCFSLMSWRWTRKNMVGTMCWFLETVVCRVY